MRSKVIFGVLSDRFGRKWPLVINLVIVSILELGAGFVTTFSQFLALRSLFGIGMGGIWGLAASTALENLPVEARGLASGVLQQGYAVGYLLAAVINLRLVPETATTWRSLFWCASGISLFAAGVRAVLPESAVFLRAKQAETASGLSTGKKTKIFLHETKEMLKAHWLLCIYAVLLMTGKYRIFFSFFDFFHLCRFLRLCVGSSNVFGIIGFNFLSHGSQVSDPLHGAYLKRSPVHPPSLTSSHHTTSFLYRLTLTDVYL